MSEKREKRENRIICDERLSHIAFIMDGNGRWARARGLPRSAGHRAGAKTFRRLVDYAKVIGLRHMTVYAFSTENWSRPADEVESIMKLLEQYIDEALADVAENDVRVIFIGDKERLSDKLKEKIAHLENISRDNHLILNIALGYGSRAEIVHAVREAIASGEDDITEEVIERHLYTKNSPPPDLIIRTAGELRLSNFLLWQAAYSELYFTDKLWPDLREEDVDAAVTEFYRRTRRFGAVVEKDPK